MSKLLQVVHYLNWRRYLKAPHNYHCVEIFCLAILILNVDLIVQELLVKCCTNAEHLRQISWQPDLYRDITTGVMNERMNQPTNKLAWWE